MAKKLRWFRSETRAGRVRWFCGDFVIERRSLELPKPYILVHLEKEIGRTAKLGEAKELAAQLDSYDSSL